VRKVEVESFLDFIKEIEIFDLSADPVVFRGQPVKGDLLPSVARKNRNVDTTDDERRVLEQLKLQGASMIPAGGTTDLDLLVLAQHHGLRTRLLDWTSNPLAAIWFACADMKDGDVYVYALDASSLLTKNVYERDPFTLPETSLFQPRLNNVRIIAQHGWFTLHRFAKKSSQFVPLERNPNKAKYLHEYHIPAAKRFEILRSLGRHGVTAKTMYPDLNGLCQHLNWRHGVT
jgi:hypothetical protein